MTATIDTATYGYTGWETPTQKPDTKPGDYFVSVINERRVVALALGPYTDDHAGALAQVEKVRHYLRDHDAFNAWAYGTVRLARGSGKTGKLNAALGGVA